MSEFFAAEGKQVWVAEHGTEQMDGSSASAQVESAELPAAPARLAAQGRRHQLATRVPPVVAPSPPASTASAASAGAPMLPGVDEGGAARGSAGSSSSGGGHAGCPAPLLQEGGAVSRHCLRHFVVVPNPVLSNHQRHTG